MHNIVHKIYSQIALAMSHPGSEAYHLETLRKQYFIERRRCCSATAQRGKGIRPASAMELTSRVRTYCRKEYEQRHIRYKVYTRHLGQHVSNFCLMLASSTSPMQEFAG